MPRPPNYYIHPGGILRPWPVDWMRHLAGLDAIALDQAIAQQEGYGASPSNLPTRLNNPGDLIYAGQPGATRDASGFARFATAEAGWAALDAQLALDASRGLTLSQEISKWAPPTQNNTAAYLSNISSWTGADPTSSLTDILAGNSGAAAPDSAAGGSLDASLLDPPAGDSIGISATLATAAVLGAAVLVALWRR
ncbi:MAG: hypothetical protein U0Q18_25255 [Bryobacteraceae bacterium]